MVTVSVRQKVIALYKFEIYENQLKSSKMSIPPKFLSKILMGWRSHGHPIFQKLSRIILNYSDFIFYVATTKNNKYDFPSLQDHLSKIAQDLSKSLKFFRKCFMIILEHFWTDEFVLKWIFFSDFQSGKNKKNQYRT